MNIKTKNLAYMIVLIFILGAFASPNLGLQEKSDKLIENNYSDETLLNDFSDVKVDFDTNANTDAPSPSPTEYNISTFSTNTNFRYENRENSDGGTNHPDQLRIRPDMNSFAYNGTVKLDVVINITSDADGLVYHQVVNRTMMTDNDLYFSYYWFYPDHLANYTAQVDYYLDGVLASTDTYEDILEPSKLYNGLNYVRVDNLDVDTYDLDNDVNNTHDAYNLDHYINMGTHDYSSSHSITWELLFDNGNNNETIYIESYQSNDNYIRAYLDYYGVAAKTGTYHLLATYQIGDYENIIAFESFNLTASNIINSPYIELDIDGDSNFGNSSLNDTLELELEFYGAYDEETNVEIYINWLDESAKTIKVDHYTFTAFGYTEYDLYNYFVSTKGNYSYQIIIKENGIENPLAYQSSSFVLMDNADDIAPFGEVDLWVSDISNCYLEVEIEPYYYGFEVNQKFLVELNAKNLITNETTLLDQIYIYLHEDNVDIDYAYYSLGAGEWNITSSLYVINNDDSLSLLDIEWEDIELDFGCFDNFTLYDWDFDVYDDYLYIDDLEFFYYNMPKSTFTLEVEFSNSSMAQNTTMILKEYSIEDIGGVIISDTDYTYFPIPKELNGEYNVTFNFYLNEVLITSELHEDEELDGESIYLDYFDIDRIEGMDKLILERSMGIDSETDNWDLYGLEWELYTYEAGELEVELLMINSTLGNITHTQSFDLAEKSFSFVDYNFPVIFLIENSDQYELQFSLKFNGDVFDTETMNKVNQKNIDTNDHQASLNEYDWDYWVEEYYLYGGSYSNTYGEDRLTSIYLGIDLEGYFYTPTMFEYHANFWYKNEAADNYVLTEISSYSMLIQPGFFSDEQGGEYYDYLSPLYEGDYLIEVSATVGNQTLFHKVFSWFTYGNAPEVNGYHDISIDTRYEDRFDYYFYSELEGDYYTPHNAEYVVDIYKKDLSGEYLIYDKIYHTALSYGYQEYEGEYYFDAAGLYFIHLYMIVDGDLALEDKLYKFYQACPYEEYNYEYAYIDVWEDGEDDSALYFGFEIEGRALSNPIEFNIQIMISYTEFITGYTTIFEDTFTFIFYEEDGEFEHDQYYISYPVMGNGLYQYSIIGFIDGVPYEWDDGEDWFNDFYRDQELIEWYDRDEPTVSATVTQDDLTEGDDLIAEISLFDDSYGFIDIAINDISVFSDQYFYDTKATMVLSDIAAGTYEISISIANAEGFHAYYSFSIDVKEEVVETTEPTEPTDPTETTETTDTSDTSNVTQTSDIPSNTSDIPTDLETEGFGLPISFVWVLVPFVAIPLLRRKL